MKSVYFFIRSSAEYDNWNHFYLYQQKLNILSDNCLTSYYMELKAVSVRVLTLFSE